MSRKFQATNVSTFKGYEVVGGEVSLFDYEYVEILDDIYGVVEVAGMTYSAGRVLEAIDPVAFRCGKSDEESRLQSELEEALDCEDDSDIEFIDDCDDEEEEEEKQPYWTVAVMDKMSGLKRYVSMQAQTADEAESLISSVVYTVFEAETVKEAD